MGGRQRRHASARACGSRAVASYVLYASATLAERTRFLAELQRNGVNAVFHYTPLHRSEAAARLGARGDCPVTESISDRLVRLPFYNSLAPEDQTTVIEAVRSFAPAVRV